MPHGTAQGESKMHEGISKKLYIVADVCAIVIALLGIVYGVLLLNWEIYFFGFFSIAIGLFLAFVTRLLIMARANIVENTGKNATYTKMLLMKQANMTEAEVDDLYEQINQDDRDDQDDQEQYGEEQDQDDQDDRDDQEQKEDNDNV